MTVTEYANFNNGNISGTEWSLTNNSSSIATKTDAGAFSLAIDPVTASTDKGDYFTFALYEKVLSGSTQRKAWTFTVGNNQGDTLHTPQFLLKNGWDWTAIKDTGADRSWDASIKGAQGTVTSLYTQSALSVSSTELSLTGGTSTIQTRTADGAYQVWIDVIGASLAKADEFEFRAYEKAAQNQRRSFYALIKGAQDRLFFTPVFTFTNAWDFTLKKINGADRTFDVDVRQVA